MCDAIVNDCKVPGGNALIELKEVWPCLKHVALTEHSFWKSCSASSQVAPLLKDYKGVAKALAEHTAPSEKNSQKKGQPQNSWIDRHISYAEQLGVRWNGPVAEDLQQNDWYETLAGREADALVLSRVADPSCFFRNLSQRVGRINAKSSGGK